MDSRAGTFKQERLIFPTTLGSFARPLRMSTTASASQSVARLPSASRLGVAWYTVSCAKPVTSSLALESLRKLALSLPGYLALAVDMTPRGLRAAAPLSAGPCGLESAPGTACIILPMLALAGKAYHALHSGVKAHRWSPYPPEARSPASSLSAALASRPIDRPPNSAPTVGWAISIRQRQAIRRG